MNVPSKFPRSVRFADVEGVPATLDEATGVCRAWDSPEPRRFPVSSFDRNGTLLSEDEFRARLDAAIKFPEGTRFMLDEGVPFTVSPELAVRNWLGGSPVRASPDLLFRTTARDVSEAEFRAAVTASKAA